MSLMSRPEYIDIFLWELISSGCIGENTFRIVALFQDMKSRQDLVAIFRFYFRDIVRLMTTHKDKPLYINTTIESSHCIDVKYYFTSCVTVLKID